VTSVTLNTAREAIYQRFVSNLPTGLGGRYSFESEKYDPPADLPWARLTVAHEDGTQSSFGATGSRKFLRRGRVLVQVFAPVDAGLRTLDGIADEIRDIFEGVTFSGLYFVGVDVRESGQDGEWFQLVVDAPFDYYEVK